MKTIALALLLSLAQAYAGEQWASGVPIYTGCHDLDVEIYNATHGNDFARQYAEVVNNGVHDGLELGKILKKSHISFKTSDLTIEVEKRAAELYDAKGAQQTYAHYMYEAALYEVMKK
jgi:hypothetical protein